MDIRKTLAAVLLTAVITQPAFASTLELADAAEKSGKSDADSDAYQRGTSAIDEEAWNDAVRHFSRVIEAKSSRADGALYWTAYALNKLGRRSEALQTVQTLERVYPSSRWRDDAQALALELRQARGETVQPEAIGDEDLKMIAINSLMHTDPEKAYPLLEKIVRSGTATKKMKERALFVLTQSSSPKAQALLAEIARGNANPGLQSEAVRFLGMNGNERNLQLLSEIYASGANDDVKQSVLQAFMIAGQKERVLSAARTEKDSELRARAIQLLGVMGARAELAGMYGSESAKNVREKILQALFIAGDAERLSQLARSEKDPELRAHAIRNLGLVGSATTPTLLAIYAEGSDRDKRSVVESLFVQGNSRTLIDLSKKEQDARLKREILQKISLMGTDDAVKYMLEILED